MKILRLQDELGRTDVGMEDDLKGVGLVHPRLGGSGRSIGVHVQDQVLKPLLASEVLGPKPETALLARPTHGARPTATVRRKRSTDLFCLCSAPHQAHRGDTLSRGKKDLQESRQV